MKKQWIWQVLLIVIAIALVGCSGTTNNSQAGSDPVKITLKTNPSVPTAGKNEIILEIKDQQDKPLTGAKVDVSADHTDMSGMSMGGPATEQEAGQYAITADFSMSGNWKVTVYVRKDNLDYKKDIELKIP